MGYLPQSSNLLNNQPSFSIEPANLSRPHMVLGATTRFTGGCTGQDRREATYLPSGDVGGGLDVETYCPTVRARERGLWEILAVHHFCTA